MSEIIIPFHGGKLVVPHDEAVRAWLDKALGMAAGRPASDVFAVPRLGEYWEGQGGIYAGVMPIETGGFAHRIVSVDEAEDLQYGGYGDEIADAENKIDGAANTRALIADSNEHPAAKWCANYSKDGHSDFYLPAQRELSLAWATIAHAFGSGWYWSSTQYSAGDAWGQGFGDGDADGLGKGGDARVRPFRRLEFGI